MQEIRAVGLTGESAVPQRQFYAVFTLHIHVLRAVQALEPGNSRCFIKTIARAQNPFQLQHGSNW